MLKLLQMNKYTCMCIVPRCSFAIRVETETPKEAVEKMIKTGEDHLLKSHPDVPVMDDEKIRECVRSNIKKVD